jgi:hypothetical protein
LCIAGHDGTSVGIIGKKRFNGICIFHFGCIYEDTLLCQK